MTRTEAGWSREAAIFGFAGLLAFGTLAWEEAVHALVLSAEPGDGGSHFVRDGMLLLPLSLAAIWWGIHASARPGVGPRGAAARTAGAFALLLAPSAAAHTLLHGADETGVAHAGASTGMAEPTMAAETHGFASAVIHGAGDAVLALPVAFLLAMAAFVLLGLRGERWRASSAPRRRLALTASALVLAGAAAIVPASSAVSPDYAKFSRPLAIPPVLTGQNIDISMAQTEQQILPGNPTTMWTYNGSFPGPTIRRPTGVPTNVTFRNNLPASAGSMTVHHHGAQTSESDDGHPSRYLIAPGASNTYSYPALEDGSPERAAPQWYHDHRDMVTGRNDWMGLVGMFIYDDPFEQRLGLPKGQYDVPLMVTDREFDANNQLTYALVDGGVLGDVILVNGVPQPFHDVGDRRYRFRLYNASNRRDYSFRLSNGQAMTQIGTESGLLPAPVSRTSIRLGPAERADVVIDFAGHLGENIVLENADAALGPGDRDAEVMQFRVRHDVTDDSSPVPGALRPLPALGTPVVTRVWDFDRSTNAWTINGREFDRDRVDAQPTLGTTERWVFRNPTTLAHLVHVHLGDQKLVSRNGQPPANSERLKETWYLAPDEEVVVDVKFSDHVGKFVFHCHVLEHEDKAMMSQFQTLPSPTRPVPRQPGGSGLQPQAGEALSFKVRILSSKRLGRLLRRGLRFEAGVPADGATLRASLRARGRRLGTLRRKALSRGRVRLTLRLSRRGRTRLRRLLADRRRARALLVVSAGNTRARARFTIRR